MSIANEYMKVKGTSYARVMATSGRNFFALIMHTTEDVDKLCHGRVEVRFGSSLFQLEGKPDRAPRSDKQKKADALPI